MVFVLSDDGYGIEVLAHKETDVPPELLALSAAEAHEAT